MKEKSTAGVAISMGVPKETLQRLDVLRQRMPNETYAEVFTNTVHLFEEITKEVDNGAEFYIDRKDDKGVVPYKIFETSE